MDVVRASVDRVRHKRDPLAVERAPLPARDRLDLDHVRWIEERHGPTVQHGFAATVG
ncbi:MAG TPA: hypothetical protein VGF81_10440 [Solirubrobacteraceae bacterium]